MPRILWNKSGERRFEAGLDQGVFFPKSGSGVPWNGLVSVNESSSGGDVESLYFDGVKYLDYVGGEDFEATLDCFSTPRGFESAQGIKQVSPGLFVSQQPRTTFGLAYRTLIGNDLVGTEFGYKIHLIYNATASPTAINYKTLSQSTEAETRSFKLDAVPPSAATYRPTPHVILDSTLTTAAKMQAIEDILYGRDAKTGVTSLTSRLPAVTEIISILSA